MTNLSTSPALLPAEANKDSASNPGLSAEEKLLAAREVRTRIPMSAPKAKLSTPDIPGYHLHWLNDEEARLAQAIQGGYSFVNKEETLLNNFDLGGDPVGEGTDLGSRVSIVVGTNKAGGTMRAYLMKIPNELYKEDQSLVQDRVDNIDLAMRQGLQEVQAGETAKDRANRYVSRVSRTSTYTPHRST